MNQLLAMRKSRKRSLSFDLVMAPYKFYVCLCLYAITNRYGNMNQKINNRLKTPVENLGKSMRKPRNNRSNSSIIRPKIFQKWSQNRSKIYPKTIQNRSKNGPKSVQNRFWNGFRLRSRFWTDFGGILAPTWSRLGGHDGAMLGPCWPKNQFLEVSEGIQK